MLLYATLTSAVELDASLSDNSYLEVIKGLVKSGDPSSMFRLLKYAGKGSSGRVYKALPASSTASDSRRHAKDSLTSSSSSSEYVAIKIIPLREEKLHAISRELQILTKLGNHRNIVKYYGAYIQERGAHLEVGESSQSGSSHDSRESGSEKSLWIVMQWIDGKKLGQVVDANAMEVRRGSKEEGPAFPLGEAQRVGRDIFRGLAYLHAHLGCTQSDVDVSNVMLTKQGAVLIDMGNGKCGEHDTGMDCLRAVYIIVEMTMIPVRTNTSDGGPVNIKEYASERKESVPMLLKEVARGKYEVPDKVRELVRFAVAKVSDDTEASEMLGHSFFAI